jgi:CRISPR/Cas system CMR subunit Cmr4 (Cas7 group RAMP superfamily)
LTQCNYKSDRAIRDRLENAKRCVKEYVKEYINQMTIRFVENPVPSAAFHVWLTCNFLIKSYEETLLAFENATQGDHGVDERIKMIDTRTDEILQEYEQLQQTGPQNIELELYFWNTKLPAEQVPPVPDSKSRNLFIKAGRISYSHTQSM